MLWFCLHQIIKNVEFLSYETRNLTVFLLGGLMYALAHSYISSSSIAKDSMLSNLCGWFLYIMIMDGFAMAIIYKNKFGNTILKEVQETIGDNKISIDDIETIRDNKISIDDIEMDDYSEDSIKKND